MKWKTVFASLLMIGTLAFYVHAQMSQPDKNYGGAPYVRGNGVRSPEKGIVLLRTVFRDDGTLQGFQTMPPGSNPDPVLTNKIRIELRDGSVQEIEMIKVKKITIE